MVSYAKISLDQEGMYTILLADADETGKN